MASIVKFMANDFRYGMVDEQFGYRTDTSLYAKSASVIENCVLMRAGGLKLRPGLRSLGTSDGAKRIFSFIVSTDDRFLIVLRDLRLDIYRIGDDSTLTLLSGNAGFTTKIPEKVIHEVQVSQDDKRFIIVHSSCPPLVVEYREPENETSQPSFSVHDISLDQTTDRYEIEYGDDDTSDEDDEKIPYLYDYEGLFTTKDFPSAVAFCANRLWLASSKEHPFRIWVSKPFKYNNFQDFEYYDRLDETVTTEQYLEAISDYTDLTQDNGDGTETRVHKEVSVNGYVVKTTGTYNKETGALIGELKTETFYYTKPKLTWEEITSEESAMMLDLSSDRNEKICWIAYALDSIAIGTTSSEWVIPYSANATNPSTGKISSYGSQIGVPVAYGARNVFYAQSGGKKLRSLLSSSQGTAFLDMTYQCSEILKPQVKEMSWQRVPDQVLYAVLKDGTVGVLYYDSDYNINAWMLWKVKGKSIISCCIVDGNSGQDVIFLTSGNEIAVLDEDLAYDFSLETPIEARIVTAPLDTTEMLTLNKKLFNVYVASSGTKFTAEQKDVGEVRLNDNEYHKRYVKMHVNTQPTCQDMRLVIRNIENSPFIINLVLAEVEVGE